jgi:hypothetical protein
MNRTEIENYVKQLPAVQTQQYFYTFVGTTSKVFYRFLKRESLMNLEGNISLDNYTVKDLYEMVLQKIVEKENAEEKLSKCLLIAVLLGLRRSLINNLKTAIVAKATGIDLASMSVLEQEKVCDAMILAGFYFNCKDPIA